MANKWLTTSEKTRSPKERYFVVCSGYEKYTAVTIITAANGVK